MSTSAAGFQPIPNLAPGSAFVKRPRPANLAELISTQLEAIRNRRYVPVGYCMRMQLAPDDSAAYFQDPVNRAIAPITKVQGLTFEWDQDCYPHMVEMHERGSGIFLFPDGVKSLPKITDPRTRRLSPTDPIAPKIRQDLEYFASGVVLGRGGAEFYVLQPVMQIAIRIPTTFAVASGIPDPSGNRTALLFSKKKSNGSHTAFLVHGLMRFM